MVLTLIWGENGVYFYFSLTNLLFWILKFDTLTRFFCSHFERFCNQTRFYRTHYGGFVSVGDLTKGEWKRSLLPLLSSDGYKNVKRPRGLYHYLLTYLFIKIYGPFSFLWDRI